MIQIQKVKLDKIPEDIKKVILQEKEQRGEVVSPDSDIIVDAVLVGDKWCYCVPNGNLGNDTVIATTNAYEAVLSPEKCPPRNLGVIGSEGTEIIPFKNKLIEPLEKKANIKELGEAVSGQYLIAVLATPVTPSVVEALSQREKLRSTVDSLTSSGLITTTNVIKEAIKTKAGNEAVDYVAVKPEEEATIYDYEGNNVLNGEYYSFIGLGESGLYLSKNVANSPIEKLEFNKQIEDTTSVEETTQEEVVQDTAPVEEAVQEEVVQDTAPVEEAVQEATDLDVSNVNVSQDKIEEVLNDDTQEVVDDTPVIEEDNNTELDIENEEKEDDSMKEKFDSEFKLSLDDYVPEEKEVYNYHKSEADKYYDEPVSRGDSILPTAISTMNNLIRQNREQKEKIEILDSRNNSLKGKVIDFENAIGKLENRNQTLEMKKDMV